MSDQIGVLIVHGMGSQQPGYSQALVEEVRHRLGAAARHVVWEEAFWADALRPREDELWDGMVRAVAPDGGGIPLAWQPARQFVLRYFGDAIAYHHDARAQSVRVIIHDILSGHIGLMSQRLRDAEAPVVVLAHSLGGHIVSDYLWDRQHAGEGVDNRRGLPTLAGLVTFGCNIPLFSLAYDRPTPIDFPGPKLTPAVRGVARWLNFLDQDDVVAWPLRPLYERHLQDLSPAQQDTVARIEDHEIDVGGPITRWNPASHDGYWADDDFVRPVADFLRTILDAGRDARARRS